MRILLADDHPLIRRGLRATLDRAGEHAVVGEAHDAATTLSLVAELRPDLLLLDLEMPGPGPASLLQQLHAAFPDLKVLIVSGHDGPEFLRQLSGTRVSGFLLKDEAPEDLLQAVRATEQGSTWFSQRVARNLLALKQRDSQSPLKSLNEREINILRGICEGKDNPAIARDLSLSEQTVRNYTSTIYSKLGVNNRVLAALLAVEHHLHSPQAVAT